jgi:hypothetical protein
MASRTAVICPRPQDAPSWKIPASFSLKGGVVKEAVGEWGLASDLLGEQSPANSLFVVLGEEGKPPRIVMAHELELGEMVHGLFSFAELGFTDEDVTEYFVMAEDVEVLRQATSDARSTLADGVTEMVRQRTTLAFLAANPKAAGSQQLEIGSFEADMEKVRRHLDHCIAMQEAIEAKMATARANALAAITAHFKPTRFPLNVSTFLRLRAKN